jgi:hypothetical protein
VARESIPRKPFLLRIPPALFEQVRAMAEREMRSVNSQIEYLLAEAVRRRTGKDPRAPPDGKRRGEP